MASNSDNNINNASFYLVQAEDLAKIGFYEFEIGSPYIKLISDGIYNILETKDQICTIDDLTGMMRVPDAKLLQEVINKFKNTDEPSKFEHILYIANDKMKFVSHTLIKIKNSNKVLGMLQNISNKYHNEREILKSAYYDPLTKILNRSGFERHLNLSIKLAENVHGLAIFFIDLDDFKKINDTMGHDAGDQVLINVTSRIRELCESFKFNYNDTDIVLSEIVPSRFGGDEFVISLPFADDKSFIENFAENLLDNIKKPIFIKGREIRITTSVGISCYPENGKNFLDLLKKADTAMYKSKENNKNGYTIYNEQMGTMVKHKLKIESKLIDAINNNKIKLYYQPKVNLKTAKITSFEVLIRWDDHERGLIYPSEFISIAEETDLILELTDYIIDKCFDDYLQYFIKYNLCLSINLSSRQFSTNIFASKLFNSQEITPGDFEFEITETVLIDDFEKTRNIIDILNKKGFKCCIDDFGSGYSSFNYIKNLPISTIKMDKSFIDNIEKPKDLALVRSIIYMAKALDLKIVAEGVERFDQLDCLLKLGCDEIQGFIFSQAINLNEVMNHKYSCDISKAINYVKDFNKKQIKQLSDKSK